MFKIVCGEIDNEPADRGLIQNFQVFGNRGMVGLSKAALAAIRCDKPSRFFAVDFSALAR